MITSNKSPNNHGTSQKIDLANRTRLERSGLGTTANIRGRNVVYQIPGFSSKSPNNHETSQEIDLANRTHLERSGSEQRPIREAETSFARSPGSQVDWLLTLEVNVAVLGTTTFGNSHSGVQVTGFFIMEPPTYEFARSSASLSTNGDPLTLTKYPPGRTGGQQGPYQPNGHFRPASATDFTITARLPSRSVLKNGIDSNTRNRQIRQRPGKIDAVG